MDFSVKSERFFSTLYLFSHKQAGTGKHFSAVTDPDCLYFLQLI